VRGDGAFEKHGVVLQWGFDRERFTSKERDKGLRERERELGW